MKRKAGSILAVLVLVLGLAALCPAQTKTLTILHTNDTHSALLPFTHQPYPTPFTWLLADLGQGWPDGFSGPGGFDREYAGIARMATLINRIRGTKKNVLALNAGDVFVGSFEFNEYLGYPELKIMENLYDAMVLGNHEFDLGLGALTGVVTGALAHSDPVQLPLLCANFAFVNPNDPNDPDQCSREDHQGVDRPDDRWRQGRHLRPGRRRPPQLQPGHRRPLLGSPPRGRRRAGHVPQGIRLPGRHLPLPSRDRVRYQ